MLVGSRQQLLYNNIDTKLCFPSCFDFFFFPLTTSNQRSQRFLCRLLQPVVTQKGPSPYPPVLRYLRLRRSTQIIIHTTLAACLQTKQTQAHEQNK